ncbi:FUSC family protein [Actinocorallia sp. A-T 12471]|uniref:FUSC family protein n=1 Tax=Actinocorallia sp. A-T 12471 TaxID=3089813 RepID=UPI0029CF63F8|nr:FUSC family protein [Actinocorallia sp. A-T 12471]MDX6740640.1 FUSC family protein [Actinocorallia sp. A-T 12471]
MSASGGGSGALPPPSHGFGWRRVVGFGPGPWAPGQALAVMAVALATFGSVYLWQGVVAGVAAFIGSWNFLLERYTPHAHRRFATGVIGVVLVAVTLLGFTLSVLGAAWWVFVLVMTGLAFCAYLVCGALQAGPPGGFMYLLALSLTAVIPAEVGDLLPVGLCGLGGAAVGWLAVCASTRFGKFHAERVAVAQLYGALAALLRAESAPELVAARHQAASALDAARKAVRRSVTGSPARAEAELRLRELVHLAALAIAAAGSLPPGLRGLRAPYAERAELTGAGVARGVYPANGAPELPPLPDDPGLRALPSALPAQDDPSLRALDSALREIGEVAVRKVPRRVGGERRYPPLLPTLRAALSPGSPALRHAGRVAVAVLVTGLVNEALGLGHPMWSMTAAASVLQATPTHVTLTRGVQRCVGTLLGLVPTALLLDAGPSTGTVVVLSSIAVGLAQPLLIKHGALAMVVLTPAVVPLAHGDGLVADRFWDTVLGAGVALVCTLVLWRTPSGAHLRDAVAAAIRAMGEAATRPAPAADDPHRVRQVLAPVLASAQVLHGALADLGPRREAHALWPAQLALYRLGYALLAGPAAERHAGELRGVFAHLEDAARHGRAPHPTEPPPGWGTPETRDGMRDLAHALTAAAR